MTQNKIHKAFPIRISLFEKKSFHLQHLDLPHCFSYDSTGSSKAKQKRKTQGMILKMNMASLQGFPTYPHKNALISWWLSYFLFGGISTCVLEAICLEPWKVNVWHSNPQQRTWQQIMVFRYRITWVGAQVFRSTSSNNQWFFSLQVT